MLMTRCSTPLIVANLVTTILADRASLDCPLRQIGLDYAQMVQPQWRPLAAFQELADALNGAAEAVDCHVKPSMRANKSTSTRRVKTFALPPASAALVLFADAVRGSDADGDGSEAKPFASLHRGLAAVRTFRAGRDAASLAETDRAYLMLRAGTFYLGSSGAGTLHLGASDSFLTVQAYPEEDVTISGGTPLLGLQWEMVPDALPKRSVYEFRNGGLEDGFDAAPPEMLTVAEAQAKCSAMPTCAAFTFITSVSPPGVEKVKVSFKHEVFWNPSAAGSTYVRNVGCARSPRFELVRASGASRRSVSGRCCLSLRGRCAFTALELFTEVLLELEEPVCVRLARVQTNQQPSATCTAPTCPQSGFSARSIRCVWGVSGLSLRAIRM